MEPSLNSVKVTVNSGGFLFGKAVPSRGQNFWVHPSEQRESRRWHVWEAPEIRQIVKSVRACCLRVITAPIGGEGIPRVGNPLERIGECQGIDARALDVRREAGVRARRESDRALDEIRPGAGPVDDLAR